jgi:hypothetical protein
LRDNFNLYSMIAAPVGRLHDMTIQRMDNVLIVVEDLEAAVLKASSSDWPSSSADGGCS